MLKLSSNVSDSFPKALKLSSELSECKPLNPGGDWTTQTENPNVLLRALGAEVVTQRAGAGDRHGLTLIPISAQVELTLSLSAQLNPTLSPT